MHDYKRNWGTYTQRLINRGRITMYISPAAEKQIEDLKAKNDKKVGRPFEFSDDLILGLFSIKCLFRFPYRQLQGFAEDLSTLLKIDAVPNFRTINYRITQCKNEGMTFDLEETEEGLEVSIDASGWKRNNDGEYRSMKYDKRKDWKKIHIVVDNKTGKILNVKVTGSRVSDTAMFGRLLQPLKAFLKMVCADKGYDHEKNFGFCNKNLIYPSIPVRKNATTTRHCPNRRHAVAEQFGLEIRRGRVSHKDTCPDRKQKNQEEWKMGVGYGNRWRVEGTFSAMKRIFGEYVFSKRDDLIEKEILAKVKIYNSLIG